MDLIDLAAPPNGTDMGTKASTCFSFQARCFLERKFVSISPPREWPRRTALRPVFCTASSTSAVRSLWKF